MKNDSISDIISRRSLLQGIALGAAAGMATSVAAQAGLSISAPTAATSTLTFEEVTHGLDQNHHVAPGYTANILLRWGDKIMTDGVAFDLHNQTPSSQERQFGYNCDFTAFMPLPMFSQTSDHGLLVINHEYTTESLMFADDPGKIARMTKQQKDEYASNKIAVAMSAHGMSVVEIKKTDGKWAPVIDSKYNRRITSKTRATLAGPVKGHHRVKTSQNPAGDEVMGTIGNCGGGVTPWGTVLSGEESIDHYFGGKIPASEQKNYDRLQMGQASNKHGWEKFESRFDMEKEPLEPNRFGWVVEMDPYTPGSKPVKRTALGRFKHEGASPCLAKDGRVVVYMGDDGWFEYLYKFVSKDKLDYTDRSKNMNLLDEGTLYVAQFNADGTMKWLPLIQGQGKLTPENGFNSQADVLIDTRRAGELAGGTPMDKPEDVEMNPKTGFVFAMLSNNPGRNFQEKNPANPRSQNTAGHIIQMLPLSGDHAEEVYGWDFFILCGDPLGRNTKTIYGPNVSRNGWLACPDNCAFDNKGRIWIATDQGSFQRTFQTGDGLYAADTTGPAAATTKYFYRAPIGAELCGPSFTPDNKTLFVSVQHPGDGSDIQKPMTRWPDFDDKMPPRPSVVVITKDDGGEIGG